MEFATSIYAARARAAGVEPGSDEAAALMEQSIQEALGRESGPNGDTGGVQEVNGENVLLPMGVTADDAESAILGAVPGRSGYIIADGMIAVTDAINSMVGVGPIARDEPRDDLWRTASSFGQVSRKGELVGHVPMWAGEPLNREAVQNMRIVAIGQNAYRMEVRTPGNTSDVTDERGNVFIFDLNALIAGS